MADITVRYCTMFCATYSCISIKILYYANKMFKVQYANGYYQKTQPEGNSREGSGAEISTDVDTY